MPQLLTQPLRASGKWTPFGGGQSLPGELIYDLADGLRLSLMGRFTHLDPLLTALGSTRSSA